MMRAPGLLALAAAALLASPAAAQRGDPPVPRTINSGVLGTAEEFRLDGPARICGNQMGFDLVAGETFYLGYLGIHYVSFVIRGPAGDVTLTESDGHFRPERGRPVAVPGLTVRRFGRGKTLRYMVHVPSPDWPAEFGTVSVTGLRGGPGDVALLRRIVVAPEDASCTKRYLSGIIFEDEPAN